MALICDTGPLYAAIDAHDAAHERCATLLTTTDEPLAVPAPVVIELEWLVTSRMSYAPYDAFLQEIEEGDLLVVDLTRPDYARIRELCSRYDDLPLGLVDAAVIAIAERLGEPKLATLDRKHFTVVRPAHVRRFVLLPD